LRELYTSLRPEARDSLINLAARWGRADLLGAQLAGRVEELRATVANAKADADARLDAARRLVAAQDSAEVINLNLKQITPQAPPAFQQGILEALSQSARP